MELLQVQHRRAKTDLQGYVNRGYLSYSKAISDESQLINTGSTFVSPLKQRKNSLSTSYKAINRTRSKSPPVKMHKKIEYREISPGPGQYENMGKSKRNNALNFKARPAQAWSFDLKPNPWTYRIRESKSVALGVMSRQSRFKVDKKVGQLGPGSYNVDNSVTQNKRKQAFSTGYQARYEDPTSISPGPAHYKVSHSSSASVSFSRADLFKMPKSNSKIGPGSYSTNTSINTSHAPSFSSLPRFGDGDKFGQITSARLDRHEIARRIKKNKKYVWSPDMQKQIRRLKVEHAAKRYKEIQNKRRMLLEEFQAEKEAMLASKSRSMYFRKYPKEILAAQKFWVTLMAITGVVTILNNSMKKKNALANNQKLRRKLFRKSREDFDDEIRSWSDSDDNM